MIGRLAKTARARQGGMRDRIGISTELQTRSAYSMVNTITEKTLNARNHAPYCAASSSTVSAANASAFATIKTMMKPLTI
jgi:hypothetical protein